MTSLTRSSGTGLHEICEAEHNMKARCDILITGFGAFPGVRRNPTDQLARHVAHTLRQSGAQVSSLVLPVTYSGGLERLADEISQCRPRAILMLGLAARETQCRVELFARDTSSPLHPDASGQTPRLARSAALPLRTRAAVLPALAALRSQGLRARLSASAGRYLCNAAYGLAMRAKPDAPVLFIHIPYLKRLGPSGNARLEMALREMARRLLLQARRR
jgi:pyroglutamyl-peptidase